MERRNSEGLPRHELPYALSQRRIVGRARREDRCLLCRAPNVTEAGLCEVCIPTLDEEELRLVERWRAGVGP